MDRTNRRFGKIIIVALAVGISAVFVILAIYRLVFHPDDLIFKL